MSRIKPVLWIGISCCMVIMLLVGTLSVNHTSRNKVDYLSDLLREARQREEKAVVVRHVSKQMEEIAYQQKEISDKQRKVAELQASENFRMKQRVEEEWKKAVKAQHEALEAYQQADKQKALAEERLYQAEYAKRVADTLTYLTLGRSLGSLSITQYETGNDEIAALLAYSAWNFVGRYRGDVFLPSIFNSLSLSAGQPTLWQQHKGGITSVILSSDSMGMDTFYTTGKYGEILYWKKDSEGIYHSKTLFSDPDFDFRDACLSSKDTLYALSYNGKLLKLFNEQFKVHLLPEKNYRHILPLENKNLLLSASGGLVSLETGQLFSKTPDITCIGKSDRCLFVGRNNGDIIQMSFSGKEEKPAANYHRSPVTAFGFCPESGLFAIGYGDGTILLLDSQEHVFQKLIGHRSAITAIELWKDKLYSCGYDRTLRLWNLAAERLESVVILESSSWLHTLKLSRNKKVLWTGDENGNLYQLAVSPDSMAVYIRKNLPRNFTREEWTYYIGDRIPFETYTSN